MHDVENQPEKEGQKYNSQLDFASWPLRRRTDEEIIRLCANGYCNSLAKLVKKIKKIRY